MEIVKLTETQKLGVQIAKRRYRNREKYTVIAGYAGTGKAQPVSTIIPTPQGYRKIGELKVGEQVYDRLGRPTTVLGVFPQGLRDCYEVKLSDGRTTVCNDEHLWSYYSNKGDRLITKSLREMVQEGLKNSSGFKYKIPVNKAIEKPTKNYAIDPYVIGAFLGDGCCTLRQLTLSSNDIELVEEIGRLIQCTPVKSPHNYNWTFQLPSSDERKTKVQTKDFFSKYSQDIIKNSFEKRIPLEYKEGDIEQRLSLIQGLFDTDGSISYSEGRYNIRFTSVNKNLIQDLREVLWSLGYENSITVDKRKEKYKNGVCYNLIIRVDNQEKHKLFRLSRKKQIAEKAKETKQQRRYDRISIIEVNKLNYQEEMVCIKVDNSEELYLTNDFIVTHNTTMVNHLIEELQIPKKKIAYATFTGKASLVLQQKGLPATTLHKLLYNSFVDEEGIFHHSPKDKLDKEYELIVIDEVSMCPAYIWKQALKHNIHIIALGDPFQLPPIGEDNGVLQKPHIFLTEVMRQALESDIIKLSMDIRNGKPLEPMDGNDVKVITKEQLVTGMYTWADQILCGRNNTRRKINQEVRKLLEFDEQPQQGDKVICLKNYWNILTSQKDPLINGMIGTITEIDTIQEDKDKMELTFSPEFNDSYVNLKNVDYKLITTGTPSDRVPTPKEQYQQKKDETTKRVEFDYGYCITVWKSQGSQFNKVLFFAERLGNMSDTDYAKYLYTGLTRAVDKIVIVI